MIQPDIIKVIAIAFFIIIIAAINFTNFSTSLAPLRIKSINTQKLNTAEKRLAFVK